MAKNPKVPSERAIDLVSLYGASEAWVSHSGCSSTSVFTARCARRDSDREALLTYIAELERELSLARSNAGCDAQNAAGVDDPNRYL